MPAWPGTPKGGAAPADCGGSLVVALLWCLALLSLVVVGILHTARMDLQVSRHYVDRIQARYLAIAGIEKAKALAYQDVRERSRSGQSHGGTLFNAPALFRDIPLGRGTFSVLRGGRPEEGGGIVYGIDDEESRLNVNTATVDDLGRLPYMTPGIPAAIADWRDADRNVTAGGGEIDTYLSMAPPGVPRDGPFQTLRELLMVRGMDVLRFKGDDERLNDLANEIGGDDESPGGSGADRGPLSASAGSGWAASLTVHSGVANVSATGQERIDVQSASEAELTTVRGITSDIARAIVAHRGQNRFGSLADLLDVGPAPAGGQPTAGNPPGQPGRPPGAGPGGLPGNRPGGGGGGGGGPKVIDQNLLVDIADSLSVDSATVQTGVVNINTAGVQTLACLPGISRELAQGIVSYRSSAGFLPNIAALLRVPGMTPEIFKQVAARVTARSETYRILAEGRIQGSGVRQRVQTTVRVGLNSVETLAYREDDL